MPGLGGVAHPVPGRDLPFPQQEVDGGGARIPERLAEEAPFRVGLETEKPAHLPGVSAPSGASDTATHSGAISQRIVTVAATPTSPGETGVSAIDSMAALRPLRNGGAATDMPPPAPSPTPTR